MNRIFLACAICVLAAGGFLACDDRPVAPPPGRALSALVIDRPPYAAGEPQYAKVVRFGWSAGEGAEPAAVRHLWSAVVDTNGMYNPSFDIIKDLNDNPARYETKWSAWIAFDAPGDSGRATVLGDDETLQLGRYYIFAVQARDVSGETTTFFDRTTNARRFRVATSAVPLLLLYEERLVGFRFLGTNLNVEQRDLPPGVPLRFTWRADMSGYSGEIAGYRYAWDLPDALAWDAPYRPGLTAAPEVIFHAGIHTLFVEAIDIAGARTLARVAVNVIAFPMDRALLFVDDYYAGAAQPADYSNPSESAHDAFWLDICSRASGFDPARDAYDCAANQLRAPGPELIGRYRNIIWTYSSESNAWGKTIYFTPESQVGKASKYAINYLSLFLLKGGHLWTLGQGQRGGGLAASLAAAAQSFPMDLRCEIAGNRGDCAGDRSGVHSMPYRDYCVTMLDKVDGSRRGVDEMPFRKRDHFDCMTYAERDDSDPVTASYPGLPPRLDLWEEVVDSGRYFNPADSLGPGGMTYTELYDPEYWMAEKAALSQPCFHPIYRMRAKDEGSVLNGCAAALWVTKYDGVVPDAPGGVAAPSVHFGFPLWFFRRSAVDSVVSVIFDEWGVAR